MATITSANSVLMMSVVGLFPVPIQIQGFSADDAFTAEDIDIGESLLGVDGKLSSGFVPFIIPLDIMLQADSASNNIFDALQQAEITAKEKFQVSFTIVYPSIGYTYAFPVAYSRKGSYMPAAKKILQPRKFSFDIEGISAFKAPI